MVRGGDADTDDERELLDALDAFEEHLDDGELERAAEVLATAEALAGPDHPEVLFGKASLAWEQDGPEAAIPWLERVIALEPDHADARYALGCAAEERGDREAMIEHYLKVHALDARADRAARVGGEAALAEIERVAAEVLGELPERFASLLGHVPVVLEQRPSRALVRDGFDPRALGLFDGPEHGDHGTPAPTRIVLFVNNLLADFAEPDELEEQIEITLLHEIGHYFGLDEDDMVRLGLD
ncbi:MAG: metallopeptidase family protein [Polyangiales bacterium]